MVRRKPEIDPCRGRLLDVYKRQLQRDVVFHFSKQQCIDLAVYGAKKIKEYIDQDTSDTNWILEYSPESFSGTEMDFAVEICDAVLDVWQPTEEKKAIINLPNTVEMSTPNSYADQVEYYLSLIHI